MDKNNKVLLKKYEKIKKVGDILKTEFIGIDEQIDVIMSNLCNWYLFPELQNRPLVINLYGLTGCGKTSLVNRIAELLDEEKNLIYWNFAEIADMSAWSIQNEIEEDVSDGKTNRIIVFDEFQYASTLNELGNEKPINSSLKVFWDLLDEGYIKKRNSLIDLKNVYLLVNSLIKINNIKQIEINDGKWVNIDECLSLFEKTDITLFSQLFNFEVDTKKVVKNKGLDTGKLHYRSAFDDDRYSSSNDLMSPNGFFIRGDVWRDILRLYNRCYGEPEDIVKKSIEWRNFKSEDWIKFVSDIYEESLKGFKLDFRQSVIFVLANLDEAYDVAFNVDPDMSPDQFHEETKKITIVDIKNALQRRFRNEQIARLGNIFVPYPSFNSEAFKLIINLTLNNYFIDVKEKYGLDLSVTEKVKKLIYDESVFPTHGTRPIFSSIQEIIKSKLPIAFKHKLLSSEAKDCTKIEYDYDEDNHTIIINYFKLDKDDNLLKVDNVVCNKENLRVIPERESLSDERQAMVALHEAGHFVMYLYHNHSLPEKVCSKTVSKSTDGFLLKDLSNIEKITTAEDVEHEIEIALGGYVAELLFFTQPNENGIKKVGITNGAANDIATATCLASKYIKTWGMTGSPCVRTYLSDSSSTNEGNLINIKGTPREDEINKEIETLIERCKQRVKITFTDIDWRKVLGETARYLSTHSVLEKEKMQELYEMVNEKKREKGKRSDTFFRDVVNKI